MYSYFICHFIYIVYRPIVECTGDNPQCDTGTECEVSGQTASSPSLLPSISQEVVYPFSLLVGQRDSVRHRDERNSNPDFPRRQPAR